MRYHLAAGVKVEPLADKWAAFSPLSGETLQLNTEAVAVLEMLTQGPVDDSAICAALATDTQTDPAKVTQTMHRVWEQLIQAGLIRADPCAADNCG